MRFDESKRKALGPLLVVLLGVTPCFGQQHVHPQPAVINGSKNPELIVDTHAQRHWLLATASNPESLQGLPEMDKLTAFSIIVSFKSQYLQAIETYNAAATASEKKGGPGGDTVAFQSQIDALVSRTFQELRSRLNSRSFSIIIDRALAVKFNIRRAQ